MSTYSWIWVFVLQPSLKDSDILYMLHKGVIYITRGHSIQHAFVTAAKLAEHQTPLTPKDTNQLQRGVADAKQGPTSTSTKTNQRFSPQLGYPSASGHHRNTKFQGSPGKEDASHLVLTWKQTTRFPNQCIKLAMLSNNLRSGWWFWTLSDSSSGLLGAPTCVGQPLLPLLLVP